MEDVKIYKANEIAPELQSFDGWKNAYFKLGQDGQMIFHRTDGPAIEHNSCQGEDYLVEGKLHREDGPASIRANAKKWYKDGLLHREDGPAVEGNDGTKWWYINGKIHRLEGPAIEWANGDKKWFVEGKEYTEEEFKELV
jgi:hypothetical protein